MYSQVQPLWYKRLDNVWTTCCPFTGECCHKNTDWPSFALHMSSSRKKCKNAFSSKFYPGGRNHQAQRLSMMMNGISRSRRLLQRWNSTSHLGAKIGPIIYANRQIQPLEIWANQFQFPPNFNLRLLSNRKLPGCVLFSLDPSYQGVEYIKTAIKSNMQLREAFYRFFPQDHEKRTNSIKQ